MASIFDIVMLGFEDSIDCPDGNMELAFIQKCCIDLISGLVVKSLRMQGINEILPLGLRKWEMHGRPANEDDMTVKPCFLQQLAFEFKPK